LWLIFGESLFFGLVILGGRRAWRGNRLLVSGTLGRAKLERVSNGCKNFMAETGHTE
jgi:hypothetical protein